MYFNGSHGCQKCNEVGKFNTIRNTMTFSKLNGEARTNEGFRSKSDPRHHLTSTPLTDLPIDMVLDFPCGDALHLLHLGIMKRLLTGWLAGSFGFATKWSSSDESSISEYLSRCKTPVEIHRGMRPLKDIPRWKATEYRTFLLYFSIVILKKHLPNYFYKHFLLFYCSIVILNSEYFLKYLLPSADTMIKSFLNIFKHKYGSQHFTSNLHNLSHIVNEVERFGALENFDAYRFENKLQAIKKMIRSGKNHLAQLRNRIIELENLDTQKVQNTAEAVVLSGNLKVYDSDIFNGIDGSTNSLFKVAKFPTFEIKTHVETDKWVMTKEKDIVSVKYFVLNEVNECFFVGAPIKKTDNLFEVPFPSNSLFIYSAMKKIGKPKLYKVQDIVCKMFPVPNIEDELLSESDDETEGIPFEVVFVPLWHTLE